MKSMLRSFALVGLLGFFVGCDNNPGAPTAEGTNKTGESNIRKEGEKAAAGGPRKGAAGAIAPAPAKPD